MKLTIFGSTGKTGIHIAQKALEAGHEVTAFARNPEKLEITHDRLTIYEGDALNGNTVADAISSSDAVISLIGVNPKSKEHTLLRCTTNIVEGMRRHSVRRLVISAGAGVGDPNDRGLMPKLIGGVLKLVARNVYEDGVKTAGYVRSLDDIDWTIVRVPMLTDEPGNSNALRVGYLGKGTGRKLSREDMAGFMLDEVTANRYLKQAPVISN